MSPSEEEILDATSAWHKSDTHLSLFEWFGWTWHEYQKWVEDPDQVPDRPLLTHDQEKPTDMTSEEDGHDEVQED